TATPHGPAPTRTFPVTLFVFGLIRANVPPPLLPTQTAPKPPTSEHGLLPVLIRATTCGVPVAAAEAVTATRTTAGATRRARSFTPSKLEPSRLGVKVHFGAGLVDQSSGRSRAPEVLVELNRSAPETLSLQLERALRDGVRSGSLKAGTSLPS